MRWKLKASIVVLTPDLRTWEVLGTSRRDVTGATVVALPDGSAMLVGGADSKGRAGDVEIIDPPPE